MNARYLCRRNRGFTLVEIMIVVSVIGLLTAIAVPNFIKARALTGKNVCISNLKDIDAAKATWALEKKKTTGDTAADTELFGNDGYMRDKPVCPTAGTYTVQPLGTKPDCSLGPTDGHIF